MSHLTVIFSANETQVYANKTESLSVMNVIIIHLKHPLFFFFFLPVLIRQFPAVQHLLERCVVGESLPKLNRTILKAGFS